MVEVNKSYRVTITFHGFCYDTAVILSIHLSSNTQSCSNNERRVVRECDCVWLAAALC